MRIQIVIPVYGQPRLIDDCVDSLCKLTDLDHPPLLIWDDGSDALTGKICEQLAKEYNYAEVVHRRHQGIHKTWNEIIDYIDPCDWILLLGSDTMLMQPDTLGIWREEIALLESAYGEIGACHAALYTSPEIVQWCGSYDGAYERERGVTSIGGHLRCGSPLATGLTPWITHSAVMLNYKALKEVKEHYGSYYDERYEIYCGDRDMSYRLRSLGWQCAVASRVQVIHQNSGGQSVSKAYDQQDRVFWLKHDRALLSQTWDDVMQDEDAVLPPPSDELLKVNLGCGRDYREGWINVDACDYKTDINIDITSPRLLAKLGGRCSNVVASHVLEHFEQYRNQEILTLWLGLLAPGGELEITVPDFKWVAKQWVELPDGLLDQRFNHDIIFGLVSSGESEYERHRQAFFAGRLHRIISEAIANKGYELIGIEYGFDHGQGTLTARVKCLPSRK